MILRFDSCHAAPCIRIVYFVALSKLPLEGKRVCSHKGTPWHAFERESQQLIVKRFFLFVLQGSVINDGTLL